jgi:7,8-dihydropterin-6-yl-methyl-4-(beta-D-ribofuranosyl)aminobenzene 5'-phosphate synthase
MIENLRLTILADDCVTAPKLLAEHGFAVFIEADGRRILFDTGQGMVIRSNAAILDCPLALLDAIVISHGHYDHTGGLAAVLGTARRARLFLHPAAAELKFAGRGPQSLRSIGIPTDGAQALAAASDRVIWTRDVTRIEAGIWCTGEIPRSQPIEGAENHFFLDGNCTVRDPVADDQALFLETTRGIVLIAGCSHAGVTNTLERVAHLTHTADVYALIGGLHLLRASHESVATSVGSIGRRNVHFLAPCHCTGINAQVQLRLAFPSKVVDAVTGTRIRLDDIEPNART